MDDNTAIITGKNTVMEALKSTRKVYCVFVSSERAGYKDLQDIISIARERGVSVKFSTISELERKFGRLKQHIAAKVEEFPYEDYDKILQKADIRKYSFFVFLDGVEDPQNLGSIIRTAEFLGADALIIRKDRAAQVTPVVERVSQGASTYLPIARVSNIARALEKAKKRDFFVVGGEEGAKESLSSIEPPSKCALVMGGEGTGLSRIVKHSCDFIISISRIGRTPSLNVSNAFAIFAFWWANAYGKQRY